MRNRPPKSRREQIIFVLLCGAIALVLGWYFLIDGPRTRLKGRSAEYDSVAAKLEKARKDIATASKARDSLAAATDKVKGMEIKMAAGDPFRWLVNAFLEFPGASQVTIANFEPPHVSESTLLPKVSYHTGTFILVGTAYYHEFGKFLAALENHFPHMRVRRLDLSPAYAGEASSTEAEKLNFELEISMFVKPTPAGPAQLSQAVEKAKAN